MKPFNTAEEAMQWIRDNAVGPVDVFVWNETFILGGDNLEGVWMFA